MTSKLSTNVVQQPPGSKSKSFYKTNIERFPVTDLDKSDDEAIKPDKLKKPHRHRDRKRNENRTFTANFPPNAQRKSHSVEHKIVLHTDGIGVAELNNLLQTKDEQIKKLIKKISDLYTYNEEFSVENQRLSEETQRLAKRIETISTALQKAEQRVCESCATWEADKENLIQCNKNLKNDIEMMKTLVYRLNVQIERQQDKRRKPTAELPHDETDNLHLPHSTFRSNDSPALEELYWGSVNSHTLGPLLNSYEEMVREKEDLIEQHENEMNRFTGQLKEILEENEGLHKELDEVRKGKEGWREERTRMQAQIDVCRSKAELQTRRGDIAKEKLVEVLRCYEQKVQAQSLDLERLQDAYGRAKSELISYKNLNQQPEVIIESLKECQKLFEDLKTEHKNDKEKLSKDLEQLRKTNKHLESKYANSKEENLTLNIEIKKLTASIEELNEKNSNIKKGSQKLKESRDRLKARLRIALHWAHKLDESQQKMKNTWDDLKQLEAIVRLKESQIRGLHARHLEEVAVLEKKLIERDETIQNILQDQAKGNA